MKSKHVHHWLCGEPIKGFIAGRCACGKRRRFPSSGYEGLNPPRHRIGNALFTKHAPALEGKPNA